LAQAKHAEKGATAKGGMTDQQFVDMAGQTDLIEAHIGQMVQDMKTGIFQMAHHPTRASSRRSSGNVVSPVGANRHRLRIAHYPPPMASRQVTLG
jgi:hypothetical protein